ncbi:MAG: SDR family NAD(P)-dependent oxidoreductase, partial [Anaerolineales bacterium]|nr:SDR family NAD(P)-dependent oxidoreductase [Anaerolineales bacterium]
AEPRLDGAYWTRNLRAPVRFDLALERLAADGHTLFLELSPHPLLTPSIEETLRHSDQAGAALATLRRDEDDTLALYEAAGALFTRGLPVQWQALYPGGRFLSVPTYPWQRARFWFAAAAPQPARLEAPAPPARDSWLGRRLGSPLREVQFEARLSQTTPAILGDHRLHDTVVVPGAWYAAAGLAAAQQVLGPGPHQLERVFFPQALALTPGLERLVHTLVTPDDQGGAAWRLLSCDPADVALDGTWRLHADGRLQPADAPAVPSLNLAALRQHCPNVLTSEAFYDQMWLRGYHFGPAFRTLGALWRGDGAVLCQVNVDPGDQQRARLQLLDACLQLPAALARADDHESLYLPVGFDQLRFTPPSGGLVWGYAALRPGAERGEAAVFDIYLLEETGQVLAAVLGLQSKRVQPELSAIAAPRPAEPDLYAVAWRPAARPAEPRPAGHWLILADQGGVGLALAAELRAQGQRCQVVLPGAALELLEPEARSVDLARPDEVAQQLQAALAEGGPWRGVVHCWSLDVGPHASLDLIQTRTCDSVVAVVRALAPLAETPAPPRLWLVTRGAQALSPGEVAIGQAPLWGLGRTLRYEHPELRCTLLDLAADHLDIADLGRELRSDSLADQVALRSGERHTAHLALLPAATPPSPPRFDGAYLITGGLGALGLTVADWLVTHGVLCLALLGRSAPSAAAASAVAALRARGAQVLILSADVSDPEQLAAALDQLRRTLPPLRGVIHAAGLLDDGLLLQLTPERMRRVLAPKVAGAWHLHTLTQADPLNHFILFSSASGLLGAPGQANYAAANAFLDALAHQRRAQGRPALSLNWGPWAEVGLAAAQANRGQRLAARGVAGLSTEAALRALSRALAAERPQVGALSFDLRQWQRFYPQAAGLSFLSELTPPPADHPPGLDVRGRLLALPPGRQRRLLLETLLIERLCQILRLDVSQFDRRKPLGDFGFDSLMALELRNVLEAGLGVPLSATLLWRYPSLPALTEHLAEKMGLALEPPPPSAPEAPPDGLERVADSIADLSEAAMEALLTEQIERVTRSR